MTGGDPLAPERAISVAGAPDGVRAVGPVDEGELTHLLQHASATSQKVAVWGGGTHRRIGYDEPPDLVVSTLGLAGIIDWEPDDLTVVVGAGTTVTDLEGELGTRQQSAVLAEWPGGGTVGGAVASATSGYRRLRYGPIRDRLLEVRAVTGDGRVVKGGARVVKSVTGYDLPRLYTGSLGSLGVITSVCLKLWPLTEAVATVRVDTPEAAGAVHRPLAVLETREGVTVLLAGTAAEVQAQLSALGGAHRSCLDYPPPPTGEVSWSIRVRPSLLTVAVSRLPPGSPFVAQHGVGEVTFATTNSFEISDLRSWAEESGGAVVRVAGEGSADPWGTPPSTLPLQRRVVAAFDPARVLEPGRLPGRI